MGKNKIPPQLRKKMAGTPYYSYCARQEALHDHVCLPNPLNFILIEWEHAIIVAEKQLQREWAIIPSCWWAHSGPGLNKSINHWIAVNRATDEELLEISRLGGIDYFQYRKFLNDKFGGPYKEPEYMETAGIDYGRVRA